MKKLGLFYGKWAAGAKKNLPKKEGFHDVCKVWWL
jgi:hypothetical protein